MGSNSAIRLVSEVVPTSDTGHCFSFYYYLHGSEPPALSLYLETGRFASFPFLLRDYCFCLTATRTPATAADTYPTGIPIVTAITLIATTILLLLLLLSLLYYCYYTYYHDYAITLIATTVLLLLTLLQLLILSLLLQLLLLTLLVKILLLALSLIILLLLQPRLFILIRLQIIPVYRVK